MDGLGAVLQRSEPTGFQRFWNNPTGYISKRINGWRRVKDQSIVSQITVVCISDTHNVQINLPPGDILIHAGDLTQSGTFDELQTALTWLKSQPHKYKLVVSGNHDLLLDSNVQPRNHSDTEAVGLLDWGDLIYLNNEATNLRFHDREIKVYGSPWTPKHGNWAFQYQPFQDVWQGTVPNDVDILITHGPPKHHLDSGYGCKFLLSELWRTQPLLHVFGHIHVGHGQEFLQYDRLQKSYEAVCTSGEFLNLVRCVFNLGWHLLTQAAAGKTLLVNASIVGGFRDEKKREAIVVSI